MIQQAKINSFINSIKDTAAEKRAAISAETQEMLNSERAEMEAQAKKSADDYIKAKTASIKLEAGRRISESAAECRKKVLSIQNTLDKLLSYTEKNKIDRTDLILDEDIQKEINDFYGS